MAQVLLDGFVMENNIVPMLPNLPNCEKEGGFPRGVVSVIFCIGFAINNNPLLQVTTEKRRINRLDTQLSPKGPNLAAIP